MTTKPRRKLSKWDVAPVHGSYDWILRDIRDEVARQTPPPPPIPPTDPPRQPRVRVAIDIMDPRALARAKRRQEQWGMVVLLWIIIIAILGTAWLTGAIR